MNNIFSSDSLSVGIHKTNSTSPVNVFISSDYFYSNRKSKLFVNEKELAKKMEDEWAKLKLITRKITNFQLYFDEIDYYDSHTNIYETPVISLSKGKSKAKVDTREHGTIPKDWAVNVTFTIEGVKQKKVILESIKCILGHLFTQEVEKSLSNINEVLNDKKNAVEYCK